MTLFADLPQERLDAFLTRQVPELSRAAAQKLIEQGLVRRNGKPGKKNDKLAPGDRIDYDLPEEAEEPEIRPQKMDLNIAYEDSDVLVINKP